MLNSKLKNIFFCILMVLIYFGAGNKISAHPILPGFDLLSTPIGGATLPSNSVVINSVTVNFDEVPLIGLPIGPGNTDTIIERTSSLGEGETGIIQTEIVALSLKSVEPINIKIPEFNIDSFFDVFVELDPGLPSLGEIDITSHDTNGGFLNSSFDVNALVKITDTLSREILYEYNFNDNITSSVSPWSNIEPHSYPNDLRYPSGGFYPGVNPDTGEVVGIQHTGPHQLTIPATVPEPTTIVLLATGIVGYRYISIRRRSKKA